VSSLPCSGPTRQVSPLPFQLDADRIEREELLAESQGRVFLVLRRRSAAGGAT